jgi:succinate dehydrogenase / fumarate reductase cytochrome b subunit
MRMNTNERPINLDLTQFSFPLPALASITHRITGVILFGGLLFALYALDLSLSGPEGFAEAKALLGAPLGKFIAWALLTGLGYHFAAGLKHLFLDWDIGDTLAGAQLGARLVIVTAVVLSALAGAWLW